MTQFRTSDLHLGHGNVIKYSGRPFASADEMNEGIVERWNSVVGPDDDVDVLGDVCMGKLSETLPIIGLLNGRKVLLPGNHDKCWHGHRKSSGPQRFLDAGFAEVITDAYELPVTFIGDHRLFMCHFPYSGDHTEEDRYDDQRPQDDGHTWILHGHVHEAWLQRGRQINVGLDAWGGYPASDEQILALIEAGQRDLDRLPW